MKENRGGVFWTTASNETLCFEEIQTHFWRRLIKPQIKYSSQTAGFDFKVQLFACVDTNKLKAEIFQAFWNSSYAGLHESCTFFNIHPFSLLTQICNHFQRLRSHQTLDFTFSYIASGLLVSRNVSLLRGKVLILTVRYELLIWK